MTKGKKKKKDKKNSKGIFSPKVAKRLDQISRNPLVADVVAATLVAAAAALRDSDKAHRLAAKAGKDLEDLAQRGAKSGNALWQLALDVGRQSLETLVANGGKKASKTKTRSASKLARKPPKKKPRLRRKASNPRRKPHGGPESDRLRGRHPVDKMGTGKSTVRT